MILLAFETRGPKGVDFLKLVIGRRQTANSGDTRTTVFYFKACRSLLERRPVAYIHGHRRFFVT